MTSALRPSNSLTCDGASLQYTDGSRTTFALRDVSLSLTPGRFYGIMGPSGSGKSSLLYILSGLKQPTGGLARFGTFVYGRNSESSVTRLRREKFGFVFQQPFLLPYLTALENVVIAAPTMNKANEERARTLLTELRMGDLMHKNPSQLSGGEKQRISVARAMINNPEVIFADEPTASLDQTNGFRVVETLAKWRERGTVVVVTHDPEMLRDADEIIHLLDGQLVTEAATENGSAARVA